MIRPLFVPSCTTVTITPDVIGGGWRVVVEASDDDDLRGGVLRLSTRALHDLDVRVGRAIAAMDAGTPKEAA